MVPAPDVASVCGDWGVKIVQPNRQLHLALSASHQPSGQSRLAALLAAH